jgi:hypothetical protein
MTGQDKNMATATLSKKAQVAQDQEEAIAKLRELFAHHYREGAPVIRTILRHCSQSGMSRDISLVYVNDAGNLQNITYWAGLALGWTLTDRNGSRAIKVGGAGMDMGFHLVYTLSRVLFNDDTTGDAGYRLRQEWL